MGIQERRRQKRIKEYVINRDGMICCYCDRLLSPDTITLEHIVPDSFKGTFNTTNLTVSCSEHNNQRGNKPFFDYCKKFNWSENKLLKYKKLYFNNLKIKVLNIAKEKCLPKAINSENHAIPIEIVRQACKVLKIKGIDFSDYEINHNFEIKFNDFCDRKRIKFTFEQLIKIIEADV